MASFIQNLKNEIAKEKNKGDHCTLAFLYAVIMCGGSIAQRGGEKYLEISTSSKQVVEKLMEITRNVYGGYIESETDEESILNHTTYIVKIDFAFAKSILQDLDILQGGTYNFNFNENIISNECCKTAFLKAIVLQTASSNIKLFEEGKLGGYHMEFVFQKEEIADVVADLLAEQNIIERTVWRGNLPVVYLSDYDSILSLVGLLGAHKTYLDLENENASRSVNKEVNRQVNFASANLNRQSEVSAKQIKAINEIDDLIGLASLPYSLFVVAKARLENPELSLSDLISKIDEPLTKSGINHRFRKIMEIHKNLKN